MTRLLKTTPPIAHDRVVMDYDQRLMRRKLLTSAGGREFLVDLPSVTNLDDFSVVGSQVFTAANGDRIEAMITGVFVPTAEGDLEATLTGVITGGTARFTGVSGSYDFLIVARPAAFGFNSTAIFSGSIASVGSLPR